MATYESRFWDRSGNVFQMPKAQIDLSDVRVLHAGVDTVKQLYKCSLRLERLGEIEALESGSVLNAGGQDWKVSRSGKKAGYQYILSNQDIGFVVLLKSFYAEAERHASHLKIEVSPWVIKQHSAETLTKRIDEIARIFAVELAPAGIAVHVAVDVKNLNIANDFENRFVARSKKSTKFSGISDLQFDLSEASVVYGDRQTMTWGSAGGLQFSIYDKVTEAIKSDKIDFWEGIWRDMPSVGDPFESEYQPGDSVRRIEARFHHSVIQQFANGTLDNEGNPIRLRDYSDVALHLTALWRYALDVYRLQHSHRYIDPLWQLLIEDVRIYHPAPALIYRRERAPSTPNIRRNVAMWLGNVARVGARRRLLPDHLAKNVLASGLESELADYFGLTVFGSDNAVLLALTDFFQRRMGDHILSGVAA